jgi:cell division protein FtsL
LILTLTLVVSGCLPVTLLSFAGTIHTNNKLNDLETKIDALKQNNNDVLPQKVEKPKLDTYVGMDAFTRNFYETMYPKLK